MEFLKFFFTSEDKILETTSSNFYNNWMIIVTMKQFQS